MSNDVLITPASRKIEFKDSGGNVDGKIELDGNGNLNITSPGGDIGLGDPTADVFIGDGTNNVDIVFEQNGEIRGLTGRTLTLGQSDSNVTVTAQNFTVTNDIDLDGAIIEKAYECTGTVLDPSNGTLQYKTLSANTTFTESFADGESITLMIDDGAAYTVTWPTMTWASGSAPTLATSGYTTIVLWHRGSLYGAVVS